MSFRVVKDLDPNLNAMFCTVLDAAIAIREDGSIIAWNKVAEQMFGWTFKEVHGAKLSQLIIPPEYRARHYEGLKRYLETGIAKILGTHIEVSAIDRSGRRFPAELSTTEVQNDGRRVFIAFMRDISARKTIEDASNALRERLELAIGAHSIGVFDTDPEKGQVLWNEKLANIYGYVLEDFDSSLSSWKRHVLSEDLLKIEAKFEEALAARVPELTYSYRIRRRDGAVRFIEASAQLFYDQTGKNFRRVGVNVDVTERKVVERRLAETEEELLHLSRLNTLGAMASSLGHELNQPLQTVANYIAAAEGALRCVQHPSALHALEALDLATKGTMRAAELIKRLRHLSTKGESQPQKVSLTKLLNDTASVALHNAVLNQADFEKNIEAGADWVFVDPVLLQQVIFNLLRNAAEAIGDQGGMISFRSRSVSTNQVMIEIKDNGPGLNQQVASQLFTAFVTTKKDGSGVGLSICRTIIEKSNGQIWASSNDDGTSFFFTLPRAA